jgi:hypothetical protein
VRQGKGGQRFAVKRQDIYGERCGRSLANLDGPMSRLWILQDPEHEISIDSMRQAVLGVDASLKCLCHAVRERAASA